MNVKKIRRNMRKSGTHFSVLFARTNAREAILAAISDSPDATESLLAASAEIRAFAEPGFQSTAATEEFRYFAVLVEGCARLVSWQKAVRNCEADADRYLRGAKFLLKEASASKGLQIPESMTKPAQTLLELCDVSKVAEVFRATLTVPLPITFPLETLRSYGGRAESEPRQKVPPIVVAFTSFSVNGQQFKKDQQLNLNIGYDLEVEIALSRWPDNEVDLRLEPLSVEPPETYSLPTFVFGKPDTSAPHTLRASKRMIIKQAASFLARPMAFTYRASFSSTEDITTEGQRHLTVCCFDPKSDPQSGYEQVDQKIVTIRDQARRYPAINDTELNAFLVLMAGVGGIAGQSLQDNLFKGAWNEAAFQKDVVARLRARPSIGSALEEHPHASGGITDLSYQGVRLELKAVSDHPVMQTDVEKHLPQTVQYVAGSDKRFGILCILDTHPKTSASGSVADDITYEVRTGPSGSGLPIGIGVIVIRGNLSKPSSL
jgi:hypothetical protein